MSYRPEDYAFGGRQVTAAWIVCLCIIGLALGLTAGHAANLAGVTADQARAAAIASSPLTGIRVPQFAACSNTMNPLIPVVTVSRTMPPSLTHDCG